MKKAMARRGLCWFFLLLTALTLSGCRSRVITEAPDAAPRPGERAAGPEDVSDAPGEDAQPDPRAEAEPDPDAGTRENPLSDRREYDETAAVELIEGTDRVVHGGGEGEGASRRDDGALAGAFQMDVGADQTATQSVAADEADKTGVSDDAEEADSALTYYTVLLRDRLGTLFECKRLNVYWETAEDHVTVFKRSVEHELILTAGAYDVSARLLEENLRVDDGWIARKDPQVIVKVVGGDVLGRGVDGDAAAKSVRDGLFARPGWADIDAVKRGRVLLLSEEMLTAPHLRTAAALAVAKTAYPDLFEDTPIDEALRMLTEEATGAPPEGVYWYAGQG